MSDELFTADHVADVLGVHVGALRAIHDFPPLIQRDGVTGYCADAFLEWGMAQHRRSIRDDAREIVDILLAAGLLNIGVRELAQMHTRGMPRFDPRLPRAISMHGELLGFVRTELMHYKAQRDAMTAQAGGVH